MTRIAIVLALFVASCAPQVQEFTGGTGGGGGTDGSGGADSGGCVCTNAGDVCTETGGTVSNNNDDAPTTVCVGADYHCDALHACGDGYRCFGGKCLCKDEDKCGIRCSSDAGCGDLSCDLTAGVCREIYASCLDDATCAEGTFCTTRDATYELGAYASIETMQQKCRQGTKAIGKPCWHSYECETGACSATGFSGGVCLPSCESNGDCPDSLHCRSLYEGRRGCFATSECSDCDEGDEFCDEHTCHQNCETSADCGPTGTCNTSVFLDPGNLCAFGAQTCAPDELSLDGACTKMKPCTSNNECAAPYTCRAYPWGSCPEGCPDKPEAHICAGPITE